MNRKLQVATTDVLLAMMTPAQFDEQFKIIVYANEREFPAADQLSRSARKFDF